MSKERLTALKSYRRLPSELQTLLRLALLRGLDGPETAADLGLSNPARVWESDRVQAVVKDYQNDIDALIADEPVTAVKPPTPEPLLNDLQMRYLSRAGLATPPAVKPPRTIPRSAWGTETPVRGTVCEQCGAQAAVIDADKHFYCAPCYPAIYERQCQGVQETATAANAPAPDPELDATIRQAKALDRQLTADPGQPAPMTLASLDQIFPARPLPQPTDPRYRHDGRSNEEIWADMDREAASERADLESQVRQKWAAEAADRARKLEQGWQFE